MLSWPMIAFGWVTNMLQRGMASWKRCWKSSTRNRRSPTRPRISPTRPQQSPTRHSYLRPATDVGEAFSLARKHLASASHPGEIEFRDLTFAYGDAPPVLRHVSAKIEAGQTVALVGVTGREVDADLAARAAARAAARNRVHRRRRRTRHSACGAARRHRVRAAGAFLFSDTLADNVAFGLDAQPPDGGTQRPQSSQSVTVSEADNDGGEPFTPRRPRVQAGEPHDAR